MPVLVFGQLQVVAQTVVLPENVARERRRARQIGENRHSKLFRRLVGEGDGKKEGNNAARSSGFLSFSIKTSLLKKEKQKKIKTKKKKKIE